MAKPPTPRQRLFTNEFELGDLVSITRDEHGWYEGSESGYIVSMSDNHCIVVNQNSAGQPRRQDMVIHEINHPRDIRKISNAGMTGKKLHQLLARYRADN